MVNGEAVKWLREQVTRRMETAKAACHDGDGNWWRRQRALYVDGEPVPDGALYEGTPDVDDSEYDLFIAEIVVYDEGRPSGAQFAHIALNDPQDVIARCEAELAILDLHGLWEAEAAGHPMMGAAACAVSDAVRHLASGYKHREGYAEHWGGVNDDG